MAGRQQRAERPIGSIRGRHGGRWYNERPSAEEIAAWFKDNVPLHDGMEAVRYVGGLTLISQNEYTEEVVEQAGRETIRKVKNLVFTPYSKVESRVQYFWDLMAAHPEWAGSIEPVDPISKDKEKDGDLPPGFYRAIIKHDSKTYAYVACSMRVRVVLRERKGGEEQGIIVPPPATKMIPILTKNWDTIEPDPYALMKAETGAVGRALGLAGMLIVPGAGVATAEDMLEAQAQGAVPSGEVESVATPVVREEQAAERAEQAHHADEAETLAQEAKELLGRLESEEPAAHQQFQAWAKERRFGALETLTQVQLRGIIKRIAKELG